MKKLTFLFALLIMVSESYAQKSGQILNQKTKEPVPYVNIQVLGKRQGFTSDLKGKFKVTSIAKDSLVFSAIGFKNKTIITKALPKEVFLSPTSYKMPEVTITNEEEKTTKIGWVRKQLFSLHYGSSNGSFMIARFFPYDSSYRNTKFLKRLELLTDSDVEQAKFNVRLYNADTTGKPGKSILNQNLITIAEKGHNKTKVELAEYALEFPNEGLFVIIEWLDLPENEYEYSFKDSRTGKEVKSVSLEPSFATESHEKEEKSWTNYGEWKQSSGAFDKPLQMEIILRN